MSAARFYVEYDDASHDEEGNPIPCNTGHLRTSWFVVDTAPGKPYGIAAAEFFAEYAGAEEGARSYCAALNEGEPS